MKNSQTIRKVMALIHKLRPGHVSLVIASRLIEAAIPYLSLVFSHHPYHHDECYELLF